MNGLAKYSGPPDLTAEDASFAPTEYTAGYETLPLMQCNSQPALSALNLSSVATFAIAAPGPRRSRR
jgi:hypothetical protein